MKQKKLIESVANNKGRYFLSVSIAIVGLFLLFASTSAQCRTTLGFDISELEGKVEWDGAGLLAINGHTWRLEEIVSAEGRTRPAGVLIDPEGNPVEGPITVDCYCAQSGVPGECDPVISGSGNRAYCSPTGPCNLCKIKEVGLVMNTPPNPYE